MAASIEVVNGDVLTTTCDVLILEYAQGFYGADLAVAHALNLRSSWVELGPCRRLLVPTQGKLPCKKVPSLWGGRAMGLRLHRNPELRGSGDGGTCDNRR